MRQSSYESYTQFSLWFTSDLSMINLPQLMNQYLYIVINYKADFPPFNDLSGLRSTDHVFWVASWVAQW